METTSKNEGEKQNNQDTTTPKISVTKKIKDKIQYLHSTYPVKFRLTIILLAIIIVSIPFVFQMNGYFNAKMSKAPETVTQRPVTKTVVTEDPETKENISVEFNLYENKTLGYSYYYPKDFIKTKEVADYQLSATAFANKTQCGNYTSYEEDDFLKDGCFVIYSWQNFGKYDTSCRLNEYFSTKNIKTTDGQEIKLDTCIEDEITISTFRIPKYTGDKSKEIGELVVQIVYKTSDSDMGNVVVNQLVSSFKTTDNFFVAFEPEQLKEKISMVIRNDFINNLYVFNNEKLSELPAPEEDDTIWTQGGSPDGKKFAFSYMDYGNDVNKTSKFAQMWGPYFNGVGITSVDSLGNDNILLPSGKTPYGYLTWSPDGRYLSYVINGGDGVAMMDTTTRKEVFRYTTSDYEYGSTVKGGRPVSWVNDTEFSYVFDGNLYLGTIDNPTKTLLLNNVSAARYNYESPSTLYAPMWSADGRFVMVRLNSANATILDTMTDRYYNFGETSDQMMGPSYLAINEVGWTKDNKFIYKDAKNNKLITLSVVNNLLTSEEIMESSDTQGFELVGNGPYLITSAGSDYYSSSTTEPLGVYNLDTKKAVCKNTKAGSFITSHSSDDGTKVYAIVKPLQTNWEPWKEHTFQPISNIIEVYDLKSCQSLGGIKIDSPESSSHYSTYVDVISK